MYIPTLNQTIDLTTSLTFAYLSATFLKMSIDLSKSNVSSNSECQLENTASENLNQCSAQSLNQCPVSSCARLNFNLTAVSAGITSGLYFYRTFTKN
tara:strand:+ start:191 stop:481 length:291 start_codon:yes stop_codon:yes gene_type:complete